MRLIVCVLVLLLPTAGVAGWLLVQLFAHRLLHDIDVALEEEAETVAELLTTEANPQAITNFVSHIAEESDLGPKKYVTVTREGQLIAEAPSGAEGVLRSGDPALHVARSESKGPGSPATVSIAVSVGAALDATRRLGTLVAV